MISVLRILMLLLLLPLEAAAQGLRFRPEEPAPPAEVAPPPAPVRPRPAPRVAPAPRPPRDDPREDVVVPREDQSNLLYDPRTRCAAWVPDPRPGESMRWSGRCRGGLVNGDGSLLRILDGRVTSQAQGRFEAGRLNGPAIVTLSNGWRVEADYTDGVAPTGILRQGADTYQGELRNDVPHGRGTWFWANGARYEGEWQDGLRSGRGRLVDARGEYDGMWRNDRRNGYGIQREGDVSEYRGEWRDDRRNGQGTESFFNGIAIQGRFVDDRPEGPVVYSDQRARYEGRMVDGCLYTRWRVYRVIGSGECR